MATAVDLIDSNIRDYRELETYLRANSEISFLSTIQGFTLKSIVLSIASYYETAIVALIHDVLRTSKTETLRFFVQKTALERKYSKLFSWDGKNINGFFSLFGPNFKTFAEGKVKKDDGFSESIKAFLELGDTRNRMVHSNYLMFNLDWTIEDIEAKFHQSLGIIEQLKLLFREYKEKENTED